MNRMCGAVFVVSFVFGYLLVYMSPVEYKTVVVYPSPSNVEQIQYQDKSDQCFQFSAELVDCGASPKKIPLQ